MIQILGYRTYFCEKEHKEKKACKFHDRNWRAKSVKDLLDNLDTYLAAIPEEERWNLHFTQANCKAGERVFDSQDCLVFDFDGIDLEKIETYTDIALEVLQLSREQVAISHSGHGLHIIVQLKNPITKASFFKDNRKFYKNVLAQIGFKFAKANLPGSGDPAVFYHRATIRLPNTENRKPPQPNVMSKLVCNNLTPLDFNLEDISDIPKIDKNDAVNKKIARKYPVPDTDMVLSECRMLGWAKKNPNLVDEPLWYSALSITARLPGGKKISHDLSNTHPAYTPEETDFKIEQAVEASGPRTCESINSCSANWSGCTDCPHWGKITSPIQIRGKDNIRTETTGFHDVYESGNGLKHAPNYHDLMKYFNRENRFITLGNTKTTYIWKDTHYEVFGTSELEHFADTKFNPKVKSNARNEFKNLVWVHNIQKPEWFSESTQKKMNFQNGVLDLATWEFSTSDPKVGFRHVLPYSYLPSAMAPNFTKMLNKITGNDQKLNDLILEYMGYSLSNDTCWAQKALVLLGEGSNGKSTFVDTLKALAGDSNYTSLTMPDLSKSEYNRQMLDGKLFNISEETPNKALSDSSLFKLLVTGGECQVRLLYKEPYFIKNRSKLVFLANRLPDSPENTHGFYRRFIIVPFSQEFNAGDKDFDPFIFDKILEELPGVLNLALLGYKRLRTNRQFTHSDRAQKELKKYIYTSDTVMRWLDENVVDDQSGSFVTINSLYDFYKNDVAGETEKVVKYREFFAGLKKHVPDFKNKYCQQTVLQGGENKYSRGLKNIRFGKGEGLRESSYATLL